MSRVTSLILTTSLGENIQYLLEKFSQFKLNDSEFYLKWVDDDDLPKKWYAGSKLLSANLFLGAYNHLDLSKLVDFLKKEIVWDSPHSVQLIVKEEEDLIFRLIDLFESESS